MVDIATYLLMLVRVSENKFFVGLPSIRFPKSIRLSLFKCYLLCFLVYFCLK